MNEKHFVLVCDTNLEWLMQDELLLPIIQKNNNKQISLRQCYMLLNELTEENEQLKDALNQRTEQCDEYYKENEQLAKEKERYKRLSEIRKEDINNRILTIKEFIENCPDNKVREILKDLFHSEVKKYDLSAQNRKLFHENEQLKQLIKETLEITPIKHSLAVKLKNSIREMYE